MSRCSATREIEEHTHQPHLDSSGAMAVARIVARAAWNYCAQETQDLRNASCHVFRSDVLGVDVRLGSGGEVSSFASNHR